MLKINIYLLSLLFVPLFASLSLAQTDSLLLNNGDVIVGEIKELNRGVLTIETDYSDDDFKIEWKGVREIYSESRLVSTLTNGRRYSGAIGTIGDDTLKIMDKDDGEIVFAKQDLVFLKTLDETFASRLYANIDFGLSLTKANNLRQVSMRSKVGYLAESWQADASYNNLYSVQDESEPIRRLDGGLTYRYYLPADWYLPVDLTFLSNTEQLLDIRMNGKAGIGRYFLRTNNYFLGFAVGASYVSEYFSSEEPDKSSFEGYLGSELNLYDIGDLSLLTRAVVYRGITESGRWRSDVVFDAKYDLPLDFYIRLGITLNYDNQPAENAPDSDYVLSSGFGWEW
jgi:hypothetical protein